MLKPIADKKHVGCFDNVLPHFDNFLGRRGGSDTLCAKRNQGNNDQREIKWLHVLRVGVQRPHKTRSTTNDFSFPIR